MQLIVSHSGEPSDLACNIHYSQADQTHTLGIKVFSGGSKPHPIVRDSGMRSLQVTWNSWPGRLTWLVN